MKLVECAHQFISKHVKNGSITLDLTSGNGKDTPFLAKLAGDKGQVMPLTYRNQQFLSQKNFWKHMALIH